MTKAAPSNVRIDITSDVNCPFCLIGVKQLVTAVDQYNAANPSTPIKPEIRFSPFSLAPHLTEEALPRREVLAKKFGADRIEGLQKGIKAKFADIGYPDANVDGQVSSSHLAHRLQAHALQVDPDKQLGVAMDIFELFHIKGIHPSDRNALAAIGVKHGIFPTETAALKWMETDECDQEVKKGYATAQSLGVTGVPFFVFQNRWAASGAMGTEHFVDLLEDIVRRENGEHGVKKTATNGAQCH